MGVGFKITGLCTPVPKSPSSFFSKTSMIGVGSKNWAAHPYQNTPQVPPPPPIGSYELIRSYNCKGDILQLEEDILR